MQQLILMIAIVGTPMSAAAQEVLSDDAEAEATAPQVVRLPALDAAAAQALNLRRAFVQKAALTDHDLGKTIDLMLDDRPVQASVTPYSTRSPDCQFLAQIETGELIVVDAPPITTYRGNLNDHGGEAALSIHDGRVSGLLRTADGELWAIEPGDKVIPGAPANWQVVYRADDVLDSGATCGVADMGAPPPLPGGPDEGGIAGSNGRTEIAFDADFEFFQANGSSVAATIADIEMIMNNVGLIYQNQVDICYAMTGIIVRTAEPDPYTSTDAGVLLCQFRAEWNNNVSFARDTAHLFTGKEIVGTTVGLAFVGVICNAIGVPAQDCQNLGNIAYGWSQSRFSTVLASRVQLTAHELGHNWSACHCDESGCIGTPCGIMNSTINGSLTFGAFSAGQIIDHRDSRSCLQPCLSTIFVNAGNFTGLEDGSQTFPFNTVGEGVAHSMVGGQILITPGVYPQPITINKAVTLEKDAGQGPVQIGQ